MVWGQNCKSSSGCGTVFTINPNTGTETLLYLFKGGNDGSYPSYLLNVNGTLYGTAEQYGDQKLCVNYGGCGTVFSLTTSGNFTRLHAFKWDGTTHKDGAFPMTGLLNLKGTLYGTTYEGGPGRSGSEFAGAIFSIAPTGKEKILHGFTNDPDGANPFAGLINVNGALYGTTEAGGVGDGTVFSTNPKTGATNVLYSLAIMHLLTGYQG